MRSGTKLRLAIQMLALALVPHLAGSAGLPAGPRTSQFEGVLPADSCTNAQEVTSGFLFLGTTVTSTSEGNTACNGQVSDIDVWYAYTPDTTDTAIFSTCGSDFDTIISVFPDCSGAGELGCNDQSACGNQSELPLTVNAGTRYLIRIAGWSGASGSLQLLITGPKSIYDVSSLTATATFTPTYTPTSTNTPSPPITFTPTYTSTSTPTPSSTFTPTSTSTSTPTPSSTFTPTSTFFPTNTPTSTSTPTATSTPPKGAEGWIFMNAQGRQSRAPGSARWSY